MENRRQKIILLGLLLVGCVLTSIAVDYFGQPQALEAPPPPVKAVQSVQTQPKTIKVYISGAVNFPGTYDIPADSRVEQAIEYAGGLTEEANVERINLAKKLKDGSHINAPAQSRSRGRSQAGSGKTTATRTGPVNLNTATLEELDSLPGIGPATAQKILDYRAGHSFTRVEEVMQVKGIGPAKFEQMKESITV